MSDGVDNPFVLWEPGTNMWIVLKLSKIKYSIELLLFTEQNIVFFFLVNINEKNIVVLKNKFNNHGPTCEVK